MGGELRQRRKAGREETEKFRDRKMEDGNFSISQFFYLQFFY
jgi:hypothetical protein